MNCDTIVEGKPVICEVERVGKYALALIYYQDRKPKSYLGGLLYYIFNYRQFGVIYPKDTKNFKIGDKVKVSIKVEKVVL